MTNDSSTLLTQPKETEYRRSVANRAAYSVDLVQDLPLLIRNAESLRRLDGPLHLTGPHLQLLDVLRLDELVQLFSKLHREDRSLLYLERNVNSSVTTFSCSFFFFLSTAFPFGVRPESPPIRPLTLRSLSPWRQR